MELKQAKTLVGVMILLCVPILGAQCQTVDWVTHRGGITRTGTNNDTGITNANQQLGFVYKYPNTASMPPEIVVDNLQTTPSATGQSFTTSGAWVNSTTATTPASGAWPPADANSANVGDYVYTNASYNNTLGNTIGESALAMLPDLGTDGSAVQIYSEVNSQLPTNASTTWAQWSFGTQYPAGTMQGTTDVSGQALAANERYAIYIRFPNSGTVANGVTHPNVDYAMVRVSWGANVDDPVTSRIFMLNFGQTGGFWLRIRTGPGDDRYFPYDGVNPLRVTLYNITPDPNTGAIVPANAVRLVPEQGRGDIHAAPVSRMFPQTPADPNYPNAMMQLTYFGRDETTAPGVLFPTTANPGSPAGFQPIPLDPTQAVDPVNNPIVADPSSSIRYAAFYCIEDDDANINNPTTKNYGVLRWRYVASPTPPSYIVDDNSSGASYSSYPGPPAWTSIYGNQCYGTEYQTTPAVNATTSTFSWKTQVPISSSTDSTTYSVYVWIPAAAAAPAPTYVTTANYSIVTNAGTENFTLDQQAAPTTTGGWRLLASHIQFPGVGGGSLLQAVDISLTNQGSAADVTNNSVVVADAVELVAENQLTNSVLASPLIQDVTWPSGVKRTVVYFATGDGHVWCLDAMGGGGTTTPYWVYPSISNPRLPNGTMNGPQDDPNYNPDLYNLEGKTGTDGRTDGGIFAIDGDLSPTPSGQEDPNNTTGNYTVVNTVPALGPFISSPSYVMVKQGTTSIPYIVVGNQNGRVYAFDPAGRTVTNPNITGETIGEPYKATLVNHIAGTGRRTMTWPSVGRDKWMQSLIEAYVDDSDGSPSFTTVNGFAPVNPAPADAMANKGNYHSANAVDPTTGVVATATWTTTAKLDPNVKAPVFNVYVWIPADLNGNFAHNAQYTLTTSSGPQIVNLDQRNVLPAIAPNIALPPVGKWRLLASDINFPVDANNNATLSLTVSNASAADAAANRIVVADSVMFVSQLPMDVKTDDNTYPPGQFDAYPSLASFTTVTDSVSWNGSNFTYLTAPMVAAPTTQYATWTETLTPPAGTSMYSVYVWIPSVGSANFATGAHYQLNTSTGFKDVYLDQNNFTPTVPGDRWALLQNHVVFKQNLNGNYIGQVTIYNDGAGADLTSNHVIALSAIKFVSESNGGILADDPPKGSFATTPTLHTDTTGSNDRVILGSGDGDVYCVDMQNNDPHQRISNLLAGGLNIGQPRWFYSTPSLTPVLQPGALTSEGVDGNYVFSSGEQVFDISNPETVSNGTPTLNWSFSPSVTENFTAPVWLPAGTNANINGGDAVVFAANQNGSVYELDGATGSQKWVSSTYGATRAPVTFLANLPYQAYVNGSPAVAPAVLLPLDTGAIIGLSVSDAGKGMLIWSYQDGLIGNVPLIVDSAGDVQQFNTSNVWRGSEAITSNMWVYNSDEGNQDNGEMNGQLHAYFNTAFTNDYIPPGEPGVSSTGPGSYLEGSDIRLAEVWDSTSDVATSPWSKLGIAGGVSPYDAWRTGSMKPDATYNSKDSHFIVYEWGDTIYTAAWGGYRGVKNGNLDPSNVPQVTFTLTGGGQNQTQTVAAKQDLAYSGSPIYVYVPGDPTNADPALRVPQWLPGYAWYATAEFTIGRSSQVFAQTPGSIYQITASAKQTSTAVPGKPSLTVPTIQLQAGQYVLTTPNFTDGSGTNPNPPEYYNQPLPLAPTYSLYGTQRNITFANPLAITTRGPATGGESNELGWDPAQGGNYNNVLTEVLTNGNRIIADPTNGTVGTLTVSGLKDLLAPMGFIKDNSSVTYSAVDTNGQPVPDALAIADRSDMYKLAQPLNNIRVARYDLRWNYRNNDSTMGVMNALPWEDTYLIPTHNSVDYPDIPAIDETVMPSTSTTDMTQQPVTLPMASVSGGVKSLNPLILNLNVNVPQYQPANISTAYYGITDLTHTSSNAPDIYGPMNITTGLPGAPTDSAAVKMLLTPTAGYVGTVIVFVDSSGTGTFQGNAALPGVQSAQTPGSTEMAFRQFNVGLAVPPDFNIQTQEQTVDLGQEPQGAGYSPWGQNGSYSVPFAPSGVGPYTGTTSPWDNPNGTTFFAPFTVKNDGNINLVNLRVAKLIGNSTTTTNIASWLGLTSDQVPISAGVGELWAPGFNPNGPPAVGNIGIVSSLDHSITVNGKSTPDSWDSVPNLWPIPNPNWPGNSQPRPTLHKPNVGDTSPTIMYLGDGPNGAQFGSKPRIGLAIPLGTPVGTYSSTVLIFEDETPIQWRNWVTEFSNWNNLVNPLTLAVDDDGILNTPMNGPLPSFPPVESMVSNPFTLKTTVTEARLTNGVTAGSEPQLDVRLPGDPPNGANAMPAVMMNNNGSKNDIYLYWASNRIANGGKWMDPGTPDAPWNLYYSTLPSASNAANNIYDWQFGTQQSWWRAINGPYPPAPAGDVPSTVKNLNPSLTTDPTNATSWLFWQYTAAVNAPVPTEDTKTFYTRLSAGVPDTTFNNGSPAAFANDPSLPKYGPKAVVLGGRAWLFWYSGASGKTRLYYNYNPTVTDPTKWQGDTVLATPGSLTWQSDPVPVLRYDLNPPCIDLIYTGKMANNGQAETFLNRYVIDGNQLNPVTLPPVTNELMARVGSTQTWQSRDIAWVGTEYQNPPVYIMVNGTQVNTGNASWDNATGKIYYGNPNGGQIVLDPTVGTVTFTGKAPLSTDVVTASYIPQTMRLNVNRNNLPPYPVVGSSTDPDGFLDLGPDEYPGMVFAAGTNQPPPAGQTMPVTRYWLFYRKTGSGLAAPSQIYYKTMRLMVRLNHGVLLNADGTVNNGANQNITVTGNVGPYEVDWVRGRVYFTAADEGRQVTIHYNWQSAQNGNTVNISSDTVSGQVSWQDEISAAVSPGDQTTAEVALPTKVAVNEGQVAAFKDPFEDKVWVFWVTTRDGTSDLYYETISPQFYLKPSQ